MMKITFLGHSGFVLEADGHRVAIDPFLSGNPVATLRPEQIDVDTIVLTHGHPDHVGDTVAIARRTGATCYSAFEVCNYLGEQGVAEDKLQPGNPGGQIAAPFGFVAFTQAFHSSSYEGRYMGQPMGAIVRFDKAGFTFHHCGDTGLFSDLQLIGELYRPDVSAIPAGDRFTMGPALAKRAAEMIRPRVAVPVHWGTWPLLTSDLSAFKPDGVEVRQMKPGETWHAA
jgi:L-ascorbate metabolism protein UlaG (beta-lactamase superfamily)